MQVRVWRPCAMSEESVGIGRRPAKARRWLTQPAKDRPVNEVRRAGFGLKWRRDG